NFSLVRGVRSIAVAPQAATTRASVPGVGISRSSCFLSVGYGIHDGSGLRRPSWAIAGRYCDGAHRDSGLLGDHTRKGKSAARKGKRVALSLFSAAVALRVPQRGD